MAAKRSRATPCSVPPARTKSVCRRCKQTVLLFAQIQRGSLLVNGIEPGKKPACIATLLVVRRQQAAPFRASTACRAAATRKRTGFQRSAARDPA